MLRSLSVWLHIGRNLDSCSLGLGLNLSLSLNFWQWLEHLSLGDSLSVHLILLLMSSHKLMVNQLQKQTPERATEALIPTPLQTRKVSFPSPTVLIILCHAFLPATAYATGDSSHLQVQGPFNSNMHSTDYLQQHSQSKKLHGSDSGIETSFLKWSNSQVQQ